MIHWKVAMMSILDVDINDLFLWTITIFQNKHFNEKSMFHIFANLFTIWAYKRKESGSLYLLWHLIHCIVTHHTACVKLHYIFMKGLVCCYPFLDTKFRELMILVSPGGGNGNPLQYSCLENPMDRVAWWTTVQHDWSDLA